jgi:hypothetical protein
MKKKVFLLSVLIFSLIFVTPFLIADETEDIDKAYACLEGKVNETCSSSLEDNIFALLAVKECKNEVVSAAKDNECWPSSGCKIKTTSQAILALDKAGVDTSDAEKWLLSQTKTPSNLFWYLEIESTEKTTCTITYSGSSHSIEIGEDKKINQGAGSCLSLSEGAWWLNISSSCYDKEFEISCDKGFLTTLLYQKPDSSTIYVSGEANSASASGTTTEKINSLCFAQGSSCDYEGSLWATLVLNYLDLDYDETPYLPYLITMKSESENIKYLPDVFLYLLTDDTNFRSKILGQQIGGEYWKAATSGDEFYDTALALLPFQYEESLTEKTDAKNWLLESQGVDGCWKGGNIRDTAFILYSVWPKEISGGDDESEEEIDCVEAGYDCMSVINCEEAGGDVLDDYTCFGLDVCCTESEISNECVKDLGGEICGSGEKCVGGVWEDASGLSYGEKCCVGGTCEDSGVSDVSECERYGGICRTSCNDDEEENTDECDYSGDVCCVAKSTSKPEKNYWWIWVLLALIVLTLIGIIFRDKLRPFWFRMKSGFKKPRPPGPGLIIPSRTTGRIIPRRILPQTQRRPVTRALSSHPASKPKSEIDDVLKKLKEMGK